MTLAPEVALLVLLAAFLHASWSAMVKGGGDPLLDLTLVIGGGGVYAALLLPWLPTMDPAALPWLGGTTLVHLAYFALMVLAYREGDLSHVYPLMRGSPPLAVALVSPLWLGEILPATGWAGIGLVCGGVLALGWSGRAAPRATGFALLTALSTATYTVLDGLGARASGAPVTFTLWMFLLTGGLLVLAAFAIRGRGFVRHARRHWARAVIGGGASGLAYVIVLWAMTRAPIAMVSALRETSVVFATLIGVLWLKEPMGNRRVGAALAVAAGAAVLKLA